MDIEYIITTAASALGAGGVGGFLGWKLRRRKETAEVKGDEIDNLRATIESVYGPIVNQLKTRVDDLESEVNELRRENARLIRENNRLKGEIYELKTGRKPDLRSLQAQEQARNNKGQFASKRKDSDGNN